MFIYNNRQKKCEEKMATELKLINDDITTLAVDAIVNAANQTLLGGGGVDGAIHRAAGPQLLAECRTLNGCPTGQAKITQGYQLPAKHVIHTVGPIWRGGRHDEPALLANCYLNSLQLAIEYQLKTIAFPAISCGIFGYPIPKATEIALQTTRVFTTQNPGIDTVYFVAFNEEIERAYQQALAQL
jgi:O-acetyl-ADP-ribose deacetylase